MINRLKDKLLLVADLSSYIQLCYVSFFISWSESLCCFVNRSVIWKEGTPLLVIRINAAQKFFRSVYTSHRNKYFHLERCRPLVDSKLETK